MKCRFPIIFILLLVIFFAPSSSPSHELSGFIAAEGRFFNSGPLLSGQQYNNGALVISPEYYHELAGGSSATVLPFLRIDTSNDNRTLVDIRELNFLWLNDGWELTVGVSRVFWGATEFVHLVDIINQTDLAGAIDGEEKLGQPMARLSVFRDWGTFDFFVLSLFRERIFPGNRDRLRPQLMVDMESAGYESDKKSRHVDFALRFSRTAGNFDIGIYHFTGTSREPELLPTLDLRHRPPLYLTPFYEQINQTGLDMQMTAGGWLFKLESLYRTSRAENFFAATGGFEYTMTGVAGSGIDLGLIGECVYGGRDDTGTTVFGNDVMLGLRLALNDSAGSMMLLGLIEDIEHQSRVLTIEASRRIGSNWKAMVEGYLFTDIAGVDPLYGLRSDDHITLSLAWYF